MSRPTGLRAALGLRSGSKFGQYKKDLQEFLKQDRYVLRQSSLGDTKKALDFAKAASKALHPLGGYRGGKRVEVRFDPSPDELRPLRPLPGTNPRQPPVRWIPDKNMVEALDRLACANPRLPVHVDFGAVQDTTAAQLLDGSHYDLLERIGRNPHANIEKITLRGDQSEAEFLLPLSANRNLNRLRFVDFKLDNLRGRNFFTFVDQLKNIEHLQLDRCALADFSVEAMMGAKLHTLQINAGANRGTLPVGIGHLVKEKLKFNHTLRALSLNNIAFEDAASGRSANSAARVREPLSLMSITTGFRDAGDNCVLEKIDLSGSKFSENASSALSAAPNSLREMNLGRTQGARVEDIVLMARHSKVTRLDLSGAQLVMPPIGEERAHMFRVLAELAHPTGQHSFARGLEIVGMPPEFKEAFELGQAEMAWRLEH